MPFDSQAWTEYLRLSEELGAAEWEQRERMLAHIRQAPEQNFDPRGDSRTLSWGEVRSALGEEESVKSFYLWLRDSERHFFCGGVHRWDLQVWQEGGEARAGEDFGRVGVWAQMQTRSEQAALARAQGEVQDEAYQRLREERASDLIIRQGRVLSRESEEPLPPALAQSYLQRYRLHLFRVEAHLLEAGISRLRVIEATTPLRSYLRELEEALPWPASHAGGEGRLPEARG